MDWMLLVCQLLILVALLGLLNSLRLQRKKHEQWRNEFILKYGQDPDEMTYAVAKNLQRTRCSRQGISRTSD